MRAVLDTNILVSALISPKGPADEAYQAWREGRFKLVSSEQHLEELRRVSRYLKLRPYFPSAAVGTMINEIRLIAEIVARLPRVDASRDPADNFLLAMALAGKADYLVTGDKAGLLALKRYKSVQIIPVSQFLELMR
jgi:putative PIN family toxin of toxin-antitoxin system